MGPRWRIDPAEEACHREVMADLGVHHADWALCKVLQESDVKSGQNRLLLTRDMVRGGPIPRLFPELEELGSDGLNAQRTVSVALLDAEGREKEVTLGYLNSNTAYRIRGPDWSRFVTDCRISKGDRLDLYVCRRGDGERCLFSFTSKGGGGGGGSPRCANGRKRARQPAAAAATVRDHKRRAKSCPAEREGRAGMEEACTGGFQRDYGSCKAADRTREDEACTISRKDCATKKEKEAARGLLMLKYAILAGYYC